MTRERALELAREYWGRPIHADRPVTEIMADAILAAVAEENEECAKIAEQITEAKIPSAFQNADFYAGEKPDGWRPLMPVERQLLGGIATKIRERGIQLKEGA